MAIVHNSYSVPVVYHGVPVLPPYERPLTVQTFAGVVGAQVLIGKSHFREITVDVTLTNHASLAVLMAVIATLDTKLNDGLSGLLTIDSIDYPNCVFLGFGPSEPAFLDGSGVHGWTQRGQMKWLQVGEVAP